MENKPKRKPNILVRFLLFLLACAIALVCVSAILFRNQMNMDALKRWFTYRALTLSDSGQAESFHYSGSSSDVFADLDGDLLVCTGNAISLYSGSGTQYVNHQVTMKAPAVAVSGDTAVVYDAGGSALCVLRQRSVVYELTCSGSLLSAHLNGSGLLTVVSQESGYRGVVTVYDRSGKLRASLRLSSAYIMDAVLADDGTTLSVVTIGQENGTFCSSLDVYDLSRVAAGDVNYEVSPRSSTSLGSSVILALRESNSLVCALGDYALTVLGLDGNVRGTVDWSDRYLKSFSLDGSGFAVAQLGKYRAGSQSSLYVIDASGGLVGTLELEEQVLSLSAAGNYFAVLTADRLDIYTGDMTLFSSLSGTQGARKVVLRDDGTAMLISDRAANLYVPS